MSQATDKKFVEAIDKHIMKHASKYSKGAKMSYKSFRRLANFIEPGLNKAEPTNTQDAFKYLNAQTKLNRLLSQKGLKLKSKSYYTQWYITKDTKAEIKRMRTTANRISDAAARLYAGDRIHKGDASISLTTQEYAETAKYITARPI